MVVRAAWRRVDETVEKTRSLPPRFSLKLIFWHLRGEKDVETRRERLPVSETERELTECEFHHHLHHHHPHPHHPLSVQHGPWERRVGEQKGE